MKFLQQLMEMAKGKSKRKKEAKLTRIKKLENPSEEARANPVAKFAQTSGAGPHAPKGKESGGKRQRQEGKKQTMDY